MKYSMFIFLIILIFIAAYLDMDKISKRNLLEQNKNQFVQYWN